MREGNSVLYKRIFKLLTDFSSLLILIVVFAFFTIVNIFYGNDFLTMSNISVIVNQSCFLAVIGIAQALAILTGGINLSIGSVMAFSTVLWGRMLMSSGSQVHYLIPTLLIIATGMFIGMVNGLLITKLKMPPFIATFAVMYACRGMAWVALGKKVIYNLSQQFRYWGTGIIENFNGFMLTVPMVIVLVLLILTSFILKRTTFGRNIYFTGANPIAAKFSGIPTDRIIILVYVLSTGLAAFAGLLYGARLNSFEPGMATKAHFEGITVALIGGFAMSGGFGNIWGVLCGAVIVSAIYNGMNILGVSSELQTLVMGTVIILSVAFNQLLVRWNMALRNELDEGEADNEKPESFRRA
ncbi:MAG: ABC transporter permease [Synergistaceae bacterium]|nr:ABC transporter permease [Synergistaceae bacterium]